MSELQPPDNYEPTIDDICGRYDDQLAAKDKEIANWKLAWQDSTDSILKLDKEIEGLQAIVNARPMGQSYLKDEINSLRDKLQAKDKRIAQLEEAVIASESAFLTQVGCDYNDVIHAAYMMCKEAIKKEVAK